jgi:large-conductance mechanosensitive channel
LLILSGEFIKPGLVTLILAKIANTLVKAFQLKGPIKLQTSKGASVTAVVAFSVLAFVLYRRFQEGWLSEEATRRMFWISLKFMILPLVLFIVVVNIWSIRKANENKKILNNQEEPFFKKGSPS